MQVKCQSYTCEATAERAPVPIGMQPFNPIGWAVITVDQRGQTLRNITICPACAGRVLAVVL